MTRRRTQAIESPQLALLALLLSVLALLTLATIGPVIGDRAAVRGARRALAETLFRGGMAKRDAGRSGPAETRFAWAIQADASHLDARAELARLHQEAGRFTAAGAVLDAWLDTPFGAARARGARDPSATAGQLFQLAGINRFSEGRADPARSFHEQALVIARRVGDRSLEAAALIGRARVSYHLAGELEPARKDLDRALTLARSIHDAKLEADVLRNQGVMAWWFEGTANRALVRYYRPALALYRGAGDGRGAATTSSNIGLVYGSLGDPVRALAVHREALALQRAEGDQAGEVDTLRNLSALYAETGDRAVARRLLQDSLALARVGGYRLATNEIEAVLAGHHAALGDPDRALTLLESVLERERDTPLLASYRLWSMAELARFSGRLQEAERYARRAQERQPPSATVETRSAVARLLVRAEIKRDLGHWSGAEQLLDEAREHLAVGTESGRWHWDTLLVAAEVATHLGQAGSAMEMLEQAADDEAAWLTQAPSRQGPMVRAYRYDRLFGLLLEPDSALRLDETLAARADRLTFRFLEHARHRAFRGHSTRSPRVAHLSRESRALLASLEGNVRDRLRGSMRGDEGSDEQSGWQKLRATYDAYQEAVVRETLLVDAQSPRASEQPIELATILASLGPTTALVAYVFAGERAFALVIKTGSIERFELPANRASLRAKVRLLDALLEPTSDVSPEAETPKEEAWAPVAASLWRILIAPLVRNSALDGIDRLGIFPADALHALPFGALIDDSGSPRRFLVESFALFFPPSASALVSGYDRERPATTTGGTLAFAVGRPLGNLPGLPFAHAEARSAVAALGGETLLDHRASETAFKARASSFRTIHVASHAVPFPDLPLLSAIKLAPTEEDDGDLTVAEILALDLHADLVTLGSCRGAASSTSGSGRPDERRRFGLIDAFLRAGSQAVVASLLPVDDQPTRTFMAAFYRRLAHQDPVAALAAAQRAMLTGPAANRHPRHWAPFVLVGRAPATNLSVGTR